MTVDVAYFTADQLAALDPGTPVCTVGAVRRNYAANANGSPAVLCAYSNGRLDEKGECTYHDSSHWRHRLPLSGLPYRGSAYRACNRGGFQFRVAKRHRSG